MSKAKRGKSKPDKVMVFEDIPVSQNETNPEILAASICVNHILMGGDDEALITHLQFDHGFTFNQLQIGINEIRRVTGYCFENWEQYYAPEQSKPYPDYV